MKSLRPRVAALALAAISAAIAVAAGCSREAAPPDAAPKLTTQELQDPQACGSCHPDHLREWSGSMHAYAALDPVFLALNKRAQRETNGALGTFCVQCHAPLAVRAGLTTDGLNLDKLDPKLLGVNCYFCHSSDFTGGTLHNNPLTLMDDGVMRGGFADPVPNTAHEASYSAAHDKLNDKSSLLCGTCHDIVNPEGTHIERTFSEWRGSFIAREKRTNCGACHMPERTGLAAQAPGVLVRKVHDHSMPSVDLALTPFPEMDAQRAGAQKILDEALTAKLCVVQDGANVRIDVTLRTTDKIGHHFPSGAVQDRRAWVELEAKSGGAVAFESGKIGERAGVVPTGDPSIFVLRDIHFDREDKETHLFWKTARVQPIQVPIASFSRAPEAERSRSHTYTYAGALPESVSMRLKLRPIDFDLIDELVATGDLEPSIADFIPTFTLAATELAWTPGPDCVSTPSP